MTRRALSQRVYVLTQAGLSQRGALLAHPRAHLQTHARAASQSLLMQSLRFRHDRIYYKLGSVGCNA